MNGSSVIARNLGVKLQGTVVLDDLSFGLGPGQHLAITGEAGSGKTTLAKALAGEVFFTGTIDIFPASLTVFVEQRAQFKNTSNLSSFYYQQRYNSTESEDAATIEQELQQHTEGLFGSPEEAATNMDRWLHRLGLEHRRHTPLIQLSNGEHKRLQLVKALLLQPGILILDSPFTGLDAAARTELHRIINDLAHHTKMVLVTGQHDIPSCITHIARLCRGKLKYFGAPEHFRPEHAIMAPAAGPLPPAGNPAPFRTAVKLVNLSVRYDEKTVLQNIHWQVDRGEKWLVKGPNGAGKSTLLSLLTGDNPQAYANEIYLFDRRRGSGESIWDIKRNIGYISPELHWYFNKGITAFAAAASGFFDTAGLFRQLSAAQEKLTAQWLAYFGLSEGARLPLNRLSSGQQRLVFLARALVKNPPLLILDEPCQGLDDEQAARFTALVDELCARLDKTLIYVSHYDHEVPSCVNRKLELTNGTAVISNIKKQQEEAA